MIVTAAHCLDCKVWILSRSQHDMRFCPEGHVGIDGGASYVRLSFKTTPPEVRRVVIDATPLQLFDDWNTGKDEFGIIPEAEVKFAEAKESNTQIKKTKAKVKTIDEHCKKPTGSFKKFIKKNEDEERFKLKTKKK